MKRENRPHTHTMTENSFYCLNSTDYKKQSQKTYNKEKSKKTLNSHPLLPARIRFDMILRELAQNKNP
jgi:hypothetical protein